jgi:hypothetical protein
MKASSGGSESVSSLGTHFDDTHLTLWQGAREQRGMVLRAEPLSENVAEPRLHSSPIRQGNYLTVADVFSTIQARPAASDKTAQPHTGHHPTHA